MNGVVKTKPTNIERIDNIDYGVRSTSSCTFKVFFCLLATLTFLPAQAQTDGFVKLADFAPSSSSFITSIFEPYFERVEGSQVKIYKFDSQTETPIVVHTGSHRIENNSPVNFERRYYYYVGRSSSEGIAVFRLDIDTDTDQVTEIYSNPDILGLNAKPGA